MQKLFSILAFLLPIILLVPSCSDEEEEEDTANNVITIIVQEPSADEIVTDCSNVHIHIDVTASDENHEVDILLHPEGDATDKIIDQHIHDHDQTVTFDQDYDLCNYGSGTCFHLEVSACADHDCTTIEMADIEFCLQ